MIFRPTSKLFFLTTSMFIISGCATLSEDECVTANWQSIGYEDGTRGYSSQRISEHRKACAEYGVSTNFDQYLEGHKRGIRQYCVPSTGFSVGMKGSRYSGVCPSDLETEFVAAYRAGQRIHEMKAELKTMNSDREQLIREQEGWQREIEGNEAVIIADSTSPKLRRELLEQNRRLESLMSEKQYQIDELYDSTDYLRQKIDRAVSRGWR